MTEPSSRAELVAELRASGWAVAVHNDYRLNGEPMTFWLFTHPNGRWVKGEGRTDTYALEQAASAISALTAPLSADREAGWLIEEWKSRTGEFQARWWSLSVENDDSCGAWTSDSLRALRFARSEDAQAYIDEVGWTEAKPTEHVWSMGALTAPRGAGELQEPCDLEGWRPIESAPELIYAIFWHPLWVTPLIGRRTGGSHVFVAGLNEQGRATHWRPLPLPPSDDPKPVLPANAKGMKP